MRLPLLVAFGLLVAACGSTGPDTPAPVAKGDRHFGIHVTAAADGDYVRAYQAARDAGIDLFPLALNWTDLEKPTGWDLATLDIADAFFGPQGLPIYLTITSPINTIVPEVPSRLDGLAFDDAQVIAGFEALLDSIHGHTSHLEIRTLIIGNEIDATLGDDPAAWARYRTFFEATRDHAKSLWGPSLAVGATLTRDGLSRSAVGAAIDGLIAASDLASITYYPIAGDFVVRGPSVAGADLDGVVARIASKPIYFQEVGYPSSSVIGGSEETQRQFAEAVFEAWDRHPDRIKYFAWLWLTDLSAQQTADLVRYYGAEGTAIATNLGEYLRTLGLRRHDGGPKPAYTAIAEMLRARGW